MFDYADCANMTVVVDDDTRYQFVCDLDGHHIELVVYGVDEGPGSVGLYKARVTPSI